MMVYHAHRKELNRWARFFWIKEGMQVPSMGSVAEYLDSGPGFVFLFNPALGPLWDVITQKVVAKTYFNPV
eukprot:scaffold29656_cov17-Prasinocladus_malaysianus.AAC.1